MVGQIPTAASAERQFDAPTCVRSDDGDDDDNVDAEDDVFGCDEFAVVKEAFAVLDRPDTADALDE